MKTILKVLGIAASIYGAFVFGAFVGTGCCDDYYNSQLNKDNKSEKGVIDAVEANIGMWRDIKNAGSLKSKTKIRKSRSEVLRAHARKWAEEGFNSEEIKQGLDLLKKELD